MSAVLDAEPIVLDQLEEIKPECIWLVPPCSADATWWLSWSCGCVVFYCDTHVEVAWALKMIICDEPIHGPDGVGAVHVDRGRL